MKERLRQFLQSILSPGPTPRWLRLLVYGGLVCGAFWYAIHASAHGRINNTNSEYNDQRVYLHYAISMADADFGYTPRMRMPLYPWLLSHAARPWLNDDLFSIGKTFNIILSMVGLVALYLCLRRWLGGWIGLCFTLMAAFQLYMLRAAYVQPELLLTTLVTVTWAWVIYTMHHPKWQNGVVAGLLLCLWFLTKASAQAALLLFLAMMGVKWLFAGRGQRMPYVVTSAVTLFCYLVPMTPYLYTSWKHFHDPFYNAQSKYYLWCEDVDDKHRVQKLNLDMNLDNLNKDPKPLPSRQTYMENHKGHVLRDMKERFFKGTAIMFKLAFMDYTPFYLLVGIFAAGAVWGTWRAWPQSIATLWEWKWECLYVLVLASAFVVLFGWFTPIKVGPRLIESVTLAPAFFFAAATHRFLKGQTETIGGIQVSMEKLFVVLFLLVWIPLTFLQAPADLTSGYFGG